jgi:ribosomal protein S6
MREYEVMLILPADAEDSVVDGVAERITGVLSQRGGEVA